MTLNSVVINAPMNG